MIRIYVQEKETGENTPPQDQLRGSLVADGGHDSPAFEPLGRIASACRAPPLHACATGSVAYRPAWGFRAADAYRALCSSGPFDAVDESAFAQLLRDLASHELLSRRMMERWYSTSLESGWSTTTTSMRHSRHQLSGDCSRTAGRSARCPLHFRLLETCS